MVFNKKGFFLELEDGAKTSSTASVTVAPVREAEADRESAAAKASNPKQKAGSAKPASKPAGKAKTANDPSLTTAEAIAAELAAAEAELPVATLSTFAPEALQPGNALRQQRRRPGASLKGFRSMANELFKGPNTGRENSL